MNVSLDLPVAVCFSGMLNTIFYYIRKFCLTRWLNLRRREYTMQLKYSFSNCQCSKNKSVIDVSNEVSGECERHAIFPPLLQCLLFKWNMSLSDGKELEDRQSYSDSSLNETALYWAIIVAKLFANVSGVSVCVSLCVSPCVCIITSKKLEFRNIYVLGFMKSTL